MRHDPGRATSATQGARLVTGGERPVGQEFRRGYWLKPTVFADVRPGMRIAQEEIFGPVLSVNRWRNEAEAIEIANATPYGLNRGDLDQRPQDGLPRRTRGPRRLRLDQRRVAALSRHALRRLSQQRVGREEGVGELLSYTEAKTIHIILE